MVEMSIRLATERPPAALISATTSLAGDVGPRSPASVVPRSLATIQAPCAAIAFASARPIPPPAPVMAATFPSSLPIDCPFPFGWRAQRGAAPQLGLVHDVLREVIGEGEARVRLTMRAFGRRVRIGCLRCTPGPWAMRRLAANRGLSV